MEFKEWLIEHLLLIHVQCLLTQISILFDQVPFLYSFICSSLDFYLFTCISPIYLSSCYVTSIPSSHSPPLTLPLTLPLLLIPPLPHIFPSSFPLFNPLGTPSSNGDPELGTQDLLLWASAPVPMVVNMLCRIGSEKGTALSLLCAIFLSIPSSFLYQYFRSSFLLSLSLSFSQTLFHTLSSIYPFQFHLPSSYPSSYPPSYPPFHPPSNPPSLHSSYFSITLLADSEAHLFVGVVRYCARSLSVADPEVRQCVRALTSPFPDFN